MDELIPQITEHHSQSFFVKYKFTVLSLCIILVALIPLIIISKNTQNPTQQTLGAKTTRVVIAKKPTPKPKVTPLTTQNAQPTLEAIDAKIQTALAQSNTDLQQASQVDTSQDSTTGL